MDFFLPATYYYESSKYKTSHHLTAHFFLLVFKIRHRKKTPVDLAKLVSITWIMKLKKRVIS